MCHHAAKPDVTQGSALQSPFTQQFGTAATILPPHYDSTQTSVCVGVGHTLSSGHFQEET